jgi:hypothetical protein
MDLQNWTSLTHLHRGGFKKVVSVPLGSSSWGSRRGAHKLREFF